MKKFVWSLGKESFYCDMKHFLDHSSIIKTMEGRLHQAYIFSGPDGVGKRKAALSLAASLFSKEEEKQKKIMDRADRGQHPDVKIISPQGNVLKVESVRKMARDLAYPPLEGKHCIFILESADRMNPSASNALLRKLEEPPPHAVFILLCADASLLLPTIVSRCQIFRFPLIPRKELIQILRHNYSTSNEENELYMTAACWAEGSLGRATDYLENSELREMVEYSVNILLKTWESAPEIPVSAIQFIDELKNAQDVRVVIQAWMGLLRDLNIIYASKKNSSPPPNSSPPSISLPLYYPHKEKDLLSIVQKIQSMEKEPGISKKNVFLEQALHRLNANVNIKLMMPNLLVELQLYV